MTLLKNNFIIKITNITICHKISFLRSLKMRTLKVVPASGDQTRAVLSALPVIRISPSSNSKLSLTSLL